MKPATIAVVIAFAAFAFAHQQAPVSNAAGVPAPSLRAPVSWTVGSSVLSFRSGDRAGVGDRDPADSTRRRG